MFYLFFNMHIRKSFKYHCTRAKPRRVASKEYFVVAAAKCAMYSFLYIVFLLLSQRHKIDFSKVFYFFLTGLIPPLLPTHRDSCVARIYSGIPPIYNEQ
jgi:hypothetical protein